MRAIVEPHNPEWASQFADIKTSLDEILQAAKVPYISIEHVGSTSVPGLAAKPHIDLDIVVSAGQVQPALAALEQTGRYQSLGELGLPGRWAVHHTPPTDSVHVPRSTYVCVEGCQALRNHLAVREVCRTNPQLREEYSRVKLQLSRQDWEDIGEYCIAKNEILGRILTEAGMGDEVAAIRNLNIEAREKVVVANQMVNSKTSGI